MPQPARVGEQMDRETARVYEEQAIEWIAARKPQPWALARLEAIGGRLRPGSWVADLGCGPGWYSRALAKRGLRPLALDLSAAMLGEVGRRDPSRTRVRADLAALPFRRESLSAALAVNCYMHLPADQLPIALAHLHAAVEVGGWVELTLPRPRPDAPGKGPAPGTGQRHVGGESFPGRLFTVFDESRIRAMFSAAGFDAVEVEPVGGDFWLWVRAQRAQTLPDYVRPGLRVLVCGLNPSLYSAASGIPYGRPGNRLWPAARAAGLTSADRDPWQALADGVGFSDFVKRATRAASELSGDEYAAGAARLEDTVRFYEPRLVCFAGLEGWRKTIDRKARPGWIEAGFGGRPAYLMPSPSGRNAHAKLEDLVAHLREALRRASSS
jgi:TDG/mug DNA glycosylase family protein